ncbi:hypothetical protein BKD30_09680 [Tersicoccus phoenicis]|uniref:DUF4345 domain-containing protein n=1 Tax=Tersicoccus phoenicis TaxID=554083 RepID=A0A1R1L9J5_9MICC|nr:DUF4345 domain-containing protein [Tersicoccus phoenicis]OMH24151.1 hypothetical protein BKD30_09680 [Tersicoccus phoenicis]
MSENQARPGPIEEPQGGAGPGAGERRGRDTRGRDTRGRDTRGRTPGDRTPGRAGENRPGSDWGTFRAVVIGVGVVLVVVGAWFLLAGTHGLPNAATGPFDPTLESQFRFFAAQQIGVGAAFIAIAVKFQWVTVLWLVCMMVFFGGVGRVISWAIVGATPHWLMIVLMILELAFPAALLVWHRWITKTVDLKRSLAAGR